MPISGSVCAIARPVCLLQEDNIRLMQLQPNEQLGVKGRREASAVIAEDA